ncbi:MAG: hypothetical protein KME03_00475 [Aphanocapsa lilacina HA4352-LM1]|jgi:hypothetical protein|uniref:Uncharacterized protein n=1 Tax=Gloeobacter morelensis MG652769 TaxID=2781736 RepID=A0ABY3PGR6_9CYAN|nr:hypothetical protein [Gloeobacter morelensis]MBW4696370.1 hypothetical protein [Aphanocapsa lilacina HA4352-LM1]UFP92863.1 hypothetical protein ISF26_13630 [Gloeobacter morelensis MG652769]
MTEQEIREGVEKVRRERANLLQLIEKPDLGLDTRQDVNQALEEIDDLLVEFERTFPGG